MNQGGLISVFYTSCLWWNISVRIEGMRWVPLHRPRQETMLKEYKNETIRLVLPNFNF